MVRPRLTVVAGVEPAADRSRDRVVVAGLGVTLLALAGLATLLGADQARVTLEPRKVAAAVLETAVNRGSDDPAVREALVSLRGTIARRPLDTKTRVAYSSVVLGVAKTTTDLEVAAFHARLAARLTPVTVPVVRAAALVLLRTGGADECVDLVRNMFGYDPGAASRLLDLAEPLLTPAQVEQAIAETPEAWLAWARQLRLAGRSDRADAWLERGFVRWPDDLRLLVQVTERAARAKDWQKLERLLGEEDLPEEPGAAVLYVFRAGLRAQEGNPDLAAADLATATRLGGRGAWLQIRAGDAYLAMGSADEARRSWNRALFLLKPDRRAARQAVLRRLARLEEEQGRYGAALRQWRALLDLGPEDAEARHRVAELTGAAP